MINVITNLFKDVIENYIKTKKHELVSEPKEKDYSEKNDLKDIQNGRKNKKEKEQSPKLKVKEKH